MKPLQVGFLGTGWIAGTHAKALSKLQGVQLTALCNHHVEKAEAFSNRHTDGRARCYSDFGRMLDVESLDVLYVCLPPGAHAGEAEAAAERGIHLMLEKPIALTVSRAASIRDAVRRAGVVCVIGHHMRYAAPVRKLKQMLQDGSAGRPLMMQGRFFANNLFPAWWRDPALGGGQLVEQAIHIYDLARHFLGEAEVVTAFADNLIHQRFPDYQVDDVSAATIRFTNGAIANLCAANCADPTRGSITFTVLCENVMAEFRTPDDATFTHHHGRVAEELKGDAASVTREDVRSAASNYDELSADLIDAIRGGGQPRSTVDDGFEGLRLVLAAAESSRSGGAPQFLSEPD